MGGHQLINVSTDADGYITFKSCPAPPGGFTSFVIFEARSRLRELPRLYINNCPPNPHHTTSLTKLPTPDRLPLAHRWPELRSQFCMVALFVLSSSLVTKHKRRLLALQSYRLAQYV